MGVIPGAQATYDALTSKILGSVQILGGLLAIIFQGLLIAITPVSSLIGAGFWCGLVVRIFVILN